MILVINTEERILMWNPGPTWQWLHIRVIQIRDGLSSMTEVDIEVPSLCHCVLVNQIYVERLVCWVLKELPIEIDRSAHWCISLGKLLTYFCLCKIWLYQKKMITLNKYKNTNKWPNQELKVHIYSSLTHSMLQLIFNFPTSML